MSEPIYATINSGAVEYSKQDAEISIDEMIEALQTAKEEGATHVLGMSGNYRGAQYVRLSLPTVEYDLD